MGSEPSVPPPQHVAQRLGRRLVSVVPLGDVQEAGRKGKGSEAAGGASTPTTVPSLSKSSHSWRCTRRTPTMEFASASLKVHSSICCCVSSSVLLVTSTRSGAALLVHLHRAQDTGRTPFWSSQIITLESIIIWVWLGRKMRDRGSGSHLRRCGCCC